MAEEAKKWTDPVDSTASVSTDDSYLTCYLSITPPKHGGKQLSLPDVKQALYVAGVRYGIDDEVIENMLDNKIENTSMVVARALEAVDGDDGRVDYEYPTNSDLIPKQDSQGVVDFRDLGLIRNVQAGTLIATIYKETEGTSGYDVRGVPILPKAGRKPKFHVGKGTVLAENETKLLAAVDGNLRWFKDRFLVDDVVIITEDVDAATGNIDFIGDVIIKGEVRENFIVKSRKNITINGNANGSRLIAGGDIHIKQGCINTTVEAGGSVKVMFCENSRIKCKGDCSSSSFVISDIFAEGYIQAVISKGVIVGGNLISLKGVVANIIGSETYSKTSITLGNYIAISEQKIAVQRAIDQQREQMKKILQIIDILTKEKEKNGSLIAERDNMLKASEKMKISTQQEYKRLSVLMSQLDGQMESSSECAVSCRHDLWPGVSIRINTEVLTVTEHNIRCNVRLNRDKLIEITPLTAI